MRLKDKHIVLGITGSIAAYKAAYLTRLLIKEGADVKIIVTPLAKEFITPVTLATLSKNTVLSDFFQHDDGSWNSHVELGIWADLMIIAPATANTIAKMAHGIADNLLLTTYLSARCPVMIAPAMDTDMYIHPATQNNIEILKQRNVIVIEPPEGELASGLTGKGRMEEPENIVNYVIEYFDKKADFKDKNVLITGGPTYEYIDPVRFIGNASTGKTASSLAQEFAKRGANVTFVCGPIKYYPNNKNINVIKVVSAEEMLNACLQNISNIDIAVFAAAVADYKPKEKKNLKIKKEYSSFTLELEPTVDIAYTLGKNKKNNQFFVGFSLETHDEEKFALEKLLAKNLDLIILNTLSNSHNPLISDVNTVVIIDKNNNKKIIPLQSKETLAKEIVEIIKKYIK